MSRQSLLRAAAFGGKIGRWVRKGCLFGLVVAMLVGTAWGQNGNGQGQNGNGQGQNGNGQGGSDPVGAPELDPGSAVGALTLLTGGLLLIGDRIRKNKSEHQDS